MKPKRETDERHVPVGPCRASSTKSALSGGRGARVSAYEAALAEMVRCDDVGLDLGSGTGILGLLACRAGARRVYAIDHGGMAQPARAIAHANGLDDRIRGDRRHVHRR